MSSYKFDESEEGYRRNLNLFQAPPVDTAVFGREWISFRPVNQITKASPIHFTIPSTSSDYKDLRKSMLYMKCRILKDGKPVTKENKVAFANLTLQSLMRQIDVSLQQQVINTTVGLNYSYKAMLDTLLWYAEDPKETHLQSQLYFKDDAEKIDATNPETGGNLGLLERWQYTQNGQAVDLQGGLYIDIFQQDKLLINGSASRCEHIPKYG